MIASNSYTVYPAPSIYKEMFVLDGRRYFATSSRYLISEYGRHGMLPPVDRGSYVQIPAKDFKAAKKRYEEKHCEYNKALAGNLNKGVQLTLF